MIHVCVPVLKRYDLFRELLVSLQRSSVQPMVHVVDNGKDSGRLAAAMFAAPGLMTDVYAPHAPMGLAETWNWFIDNVPEDRVIANDDVTFAPGSLRALADEREAFVSCGFGFSCFLIRDACVAQVGLFDEAISPGYAYFEDMDYLRRMRLAGVVDKVVDCGVEHRQSATLEAFTANEWKAHHERFTLAATNYKAKWAGDPSWEQLKSIGGEGAHR